MMALKHLSGNAALAQLLQWYSQLNDESMRDPLARKPWAYGTFSNGEKISRAQRMIYRLRSDLRVAFVDPFDAEGYLKWWHAQGAKEYPDLFDQQQKVRDAEIKRISEILPAGFPADGASVDGSKFLNVALFAVKSLGNFELVARKVISVIRTEGVSGIITRLR
jgi:hypothetical protein